MESPASNWSQDRADHHILPRPLVSLPAHFCWKHPANAMLSQSSVSAISMVRVFSLMSIDFEDAPWTLPLPLMWSIIEEQLAIVAANLPILRHVLAFILPNGWMGSSRRKASGSGKFPSSGNQRYKMDHLNKGGTSSARVRALHGAWSDDERSEISLAAHGAPPDGIHVARAFDIH